MKKKRSFLAALGAAAIVGASIQPASAVEDDDLRFDTTSDLYAVCTVTADAPEFPVAHQACRAFIEAAVQYHDAVSDRKKMKRLVCYPKSATVEDGKNALVAWGKKNAGVKNLMGETPVVGLIRALAEKYPCKR